MSRKPATRGAVHATPQHSPRSTQHLQRAVGNHATQRMLVDWTDRIARSPAKDARSGMQPVVRQQRHPFSASIRRVGAEPQHDGAHGAGSPARGNPELQERESVLFPSDSLRAAELPGQSDAIESTFDYQGSIGEVPAPAKPDKFGETTPVYEFAKPGPRAEQQKAGTFTVTGTIIANVGFWVAGGGKKDIASDTDPDITQANYQTVVRDLTPSPTEVVDKSGVVLYKNQSPRTAFWARDLTVRHEGFHADEDVKFGEAGVTAAQTWLNGQTAKTFNDVGALLNQVNARVAGFVKTAMALPGRENRAYAAGAPDYTARAQAIKTKGDAKGYAPPPKKK